MIEILGVKRIILLAAVLVFNVLLALVLYMYITPEKDLKIQEKNGIQSEVSTLRADVDRMQVEFDQLAEQKTEFEALVEKGFFNNQDRRKAEEILNDIQSQSGVTSAIAEIDAGELVEDEEAAKAEHKILKSPMSVEIEAMNDINVFHYIYLMQNSFPGQISIDKLMINRQEKEISKELLQKIREGEDIPLVKAEIEMTWQTLLPNEVLPQEGEQVP